MRVYESNRVRESVEQYVPILGVNSIAPIVIGGQGGFKLQSI